MPITLETTSYDVLQPTLSAETVVRLAASKFGNSLALAKGAVLAKKTSDGKLYAYTQPNQVQVINFGGTLSSGSFRLIATKWDGSEVCTDTVAFNGSTAAVATALNAVLGTTGTAVGGTIASLTVTFSGTGAGGSGAYTGYAWPLLQPDISGLNAGITATVVDATAYDGTDKAVAILTCQITTDANGVIYLGDSATGGTANPPVSSVPVIVGGGIWSSSQFTGLDASAKADLGGRDLFNGLIAFPRY